MPTRKRVRKSAKSSAQQKRRSGVTTDVDEYDDQIYEVRAIVAERLLKGKRQYKIDWAGTNPKTGQPWEQLWVDAENVYPHSIDQYNSSKEAKPSPTPDAQSPSQPDINGESSDDSEPLQRVRRKEKSDTKRPLEDESDDLMQIISPKKRRITSVRLHQSATPNLKGSGEHDIQIQSSKRTPSGPEHISIGSHPNEPIVELPPGGFHSSGRQATQISQSSSHPIPDTTSFGIKKTPLSQYSNRTIPDSQEVSALSLSATRSLDSSSAIPSQNHDLDLVAVNLSSTVNSQSELNSQGSHLLIDPQSRPEAPTTGASCPSFDLPLPHDPEEPACGVTTLTSSIQLATAAKLNALSSEHPNSPSLVHQSRQTSLATSQAPAKAAVSLPSAATNTAQPNSSIIAGDLRSGGEKQASSSSCSVGCTIFSRSPRLARVVAQLDSQVESGVAPPPESGAQVVGQSAQSRETTGAARRSYTPQTSNLMNISVSDRRSVSTGMESDSGSVRASFRERLRMMRSQFNDAANNRDRPVAPPISLQAPVIPSVAADLPETLNLGLQNMGNRMVGPSAPGSVPTNPPPVSPQDVPGAGLGILSPTMLLPQISSPGLNGSILQPDLELIETAALELVSKSLPEPVAELIAAPEPLGTLNPASLTLSNDVDSGAIHHIVSDDDAEVNLSVEEHVQFEPNSQNADTSVDLPTSQSSGWLLPATPSGPDDYTITLPLASNLRDVYAKIIRDAAEDLEVYTSAFTVSPHLSISKAVVSRVDDMIAKLLDLCDLPPFSEAFSSLSTSEKTKHARATNSKFSFLHEFLEQLWEDDPRERKILILARPGPVLDLITNLVDSGGYRPFQHDNETAVNIAENVCPLQVMVASTSDPLPHPAEEFDVMIGFDHTFKNIPLRFDSKNPVILSLVTAFSVHHINMRISEQLEGIERKNILILALTNGLTLIEQPEHNLPEPFKVAQSFARYLDESDDDSSWTHQEIPDMIFEHISLDAWGEPRIDLHPAEDTASRKRSHDVNDLGVEPKRTKLSHGPIPISPSHISDSLRNELVGEVATVGEVTPGPVLEVSIVTLEAIIAKKNRLEAEMEQLRAERDQFKQLADRTRAEVGSHVHTINRAQKRLMESIRQRSEYEAESKNDRQKFEECRDKLETSEKKLAEEKAARTTLKIKLLERNEYLMNTNKNTDVAKMVRLETELEEERAKRAQLEQKLGAKDLELNYLRDEYQKSGSSIRELIQSKVVLEKANVELARKASNNIVEINKIQLDHERKELLRQKEQADNVIRQRETELDWFREQLRVLNSRRETRHSSAPYSPHSTAPQGFLSPRHPGRGGTSTGSRGASPVASGPLVNNGAAGSGNAIGAATPSEKNWRYKHLKD